METFEDIEKDFNKFIKKYPKKAKKFLKKEGRKLMNTAKKSAREKIGKKTETYIKGFKVGRIFDGEDGLTVRAYNKAPHAHLIENGTVIRSTQKGANRGYMKGQHILDNAKMNFKASYEKDCIDFVDSVIEEGGF